MSLLGSRSVRRFRSGFYLHQGVWPVRIMSPHTLPSGLHVRLHRLPGTAVIQSVLATNPAYTSGYTDYYGRRSYKASWLQIRPTRPATQTTRDGGHTKRPGYKSGLHVRLHRLLGTAVIQSVLATNPGYTSRLHGLGAGIAQWLEHRTRD